MPRRVKRESGCSGSRRKSRRVKKNSGKSVKKSVYSCGNRKRRQSRKSMRGGYNEAALQKVLDAALRGDADLSGGAYGSGSSGLGGSRLNGGQSGGSRRRTKRARRTRRSRRSMRGGDTNPDRYDHFGQHGSFDEKGVPIADVDSLSIAQKKQRDQMISESAGRVDAMPYDFKFGKS